MSEEEVKQNQTDDLMPKQLTDEKLEYIFVGLLLNNPKALSVYYFVYEDCQFGREDLENLYKVVLFKEGEAYAPAIAKEKYTLPVENAVTYELKREIKEVVALKILKNIINYKVLFFILKNTNKVMKQSWII